MPKQFEEFTASLTKVIFLETKDRPYNARLIANPRSRYLLMQHSKVERLLRTCRNVREELFPLILFNRRT